MGLDSDAIVVSTHSRLKAAGSVVCTYKHKPKVSTHSRLKAAGQSLIGRILTI